MIKCDKRADGRAFGWDWGGAEVARRWVRHKIGGFSSRSTALCWSSFRARETVVVRSTVNAEKPRGVSGNVTPNSVKNLRHLAGKMTGKTKKLGPRRDIAHRCLVHGAPPRCRRRHRNRDRLPYFPRHRNHGGVMPTLRAILATPWRTYPELVLAASTRRRPCSYGPCPFRLSALPL